MGRLGVVLALVLLLAAPARAAEPDANLADTAAHRMAAARDAVLPYVVSILVVREQFDNGRAVLSVSSGSGTVTSADGLVVTNAHVTQFGRSYRVVFGDGREREADLVGEDPASDLAVLRIRLAAGERLPFAQFAEQLELQAGDSVLAMGAPWGLSNSMSAGVVNNPQRLLVSLFDDEADYEDRLDDDEPTGRYYAWIQHDAAIAPGNSGGPLVDLRGRIVGVNTRGMIMGGDLAFAIPSPAVRQVAAQLVAHGEVPRSTLGLRLRSLKGTTEREGVLVNVVEADGPAAKAGLRPGMRILQLANQPFTARQPVDVPRLQQVIAELPAGAPVAVLIADGARQRTLQLVPEAVPSARVQRAAVPSWGMSVQTLTASQREQQQMADDAGGLLVTSLRPGGPAATARPPLVAGAVITAIDGQPVTSPMALVMGPRESHSVAWRKDEELRLSLLRPSARDQAREPLPELAKAWAGVEVQPLPSGLASALGLAAGGFRVTRVYPDGPLAEAGVVVGDVLTGIAGTPLQAMNDLRAEGFTQRVREYAIGERVEFTGFRGATAQRWLAELAVAPSGPEGLRSLEVSRLRAQFRELGALDRLNRRMEADQQGVLVTTVEPGGPAGLAHLQANDVVMAIGDRAVGDLEALVAAVSALSPSIRRVPMQVLRGRDARVVWLETRWLEETR